MEDLNVPATEDYWRGIVLVGCTLVQITQAVMLWYSFLLNQTCEISLWAKTLQQILDLSHCEVNKMSMTSMCASNSMVCENVTAQCLFSTKFRVSFFVLLKKHVWATLLHCYNDEESNNIQCIINFSFLLLNSRAKCYTLCFNCY